MQIVSVFALLIKKVASHRVCRQIRQKETTTEEVKFAKLQKRTHISRSTTDKPGEGGATNPKLGSYFVAHVEVLCSSSGSCCLGPRARKEKHQFFSLLKIPNALNQFLGPTHNTETAATEKPIER